MKRVAVMAVLTVAVIGSGCYNTSIGLLSSMALDSNRTARMQRSVTMSSRIAEDKKPQIIKVIGMGASETEIAFGMAVNVSELYSGDYTAWEKTKIVGAQLLDMGTYVAALDYLRKRIDKDKNDTPTAPASPSVNGNGNQVTYQVNYGSGNQDAGNQNDSGNGGAE